ncbi:integrase arm-type DNA-binding domain-containing protein [Sphingomonas sp. TREG-RG-20F-R18-01]|uniref:tyrosine-type recombinase/integrase n=1 Tax=Sphingomonas sp. TREG-RG-20F-R18-01 TaxID=2914982 RepID=UPI001F576D70|nr:integrase arm-type DNA-binding domain-containing protein [Sphingomonas sp. TREG-RG-20F-R18-01]
MLTHVAVKSARPKPRAYKMADSHGLYLHVAPTGTKSFRLRYRDLSGREQTLTFGTISLVDARARRDAARALLDRGEDPRPRSIAVTTFEQAARAWHTHRSNGWSTVHAGDVLDCLARDVFPAIGATTLGSITRPMVLDVLEHVEARGAIETARRVRQRIEAVFEFARAKGWTLIDNPAEVREALANAPASGRQAAIVDLEELRGLVAAVAALNGAPIPRWASMFLALTVVRLAALRGMRWCEVTDLDSDEPMWRVPASRMKLGAAKKHDPDNDHLVPLSAAAADVLRAVRTAVGGAPDPAALVFLGRGMNGQPIGAGAIGDLYDRAGFGGRHVPHGWRASFSTIMNERRPEERANIDRALGHAPKGMSKVERAYNRAQHFAARRALLQEWGALIAPNLNDIGTAHRA